MEFARELKSGFKTLLYKNCLAEGLYSAWLAVRKRLKSVKLQESNFHCFANRKLPESIWLYKCSVNIEIYLWYIVNLIEKKFYLTQNQKIMKKKIAIIKHKKKNLSRFLAFIYSIKNLVAWPLPLFYTIYLKD